jgi:thiol-disulfide isomerase/thioredoxin
VSTVRRTIAVGAVGVILTASACGNDSDQAGLQPGYIGAKGQITRVDPADRKPAPVVSGPALTGNKKLTTADYAGQVIVLNVWGSWCPPCREEAPDLQAAAEQTKGKAQFVGVVVKDTAPAQPEAFVRQFKITYPSIFDPTGAALLPLAGDLPPSAIPSTLIIDGQGRVAVRVLSKITTITLVDMIDDVAAGK